MRSVTKKILDELHKKAIKSERKRAHFLFHKSEDPIQRMVNAIEPGTYVCPHRHKLPAKFEAFVILRGKAACLEFNDKGKVIDVHIISENGPEYAVDVPPGTWHSFVSLEPKTALFELVQGPYDEISHKDFAPWAPKESDGKRYLQQLTKIVKTWKNEKK